MGEAVGFTYNYMIELWVDLNLFPTDRSNYVEVQQHPWSSQMVGEAVGFTFRIELWLLIYMQIIT